MTDEFLLGTMQGKGKLTYELFAGMRAELAPTPLNIALSTFTGRMAARIFLGRIRDKQTLNYYKSRIDILAEAVKRAIPPDKETMTLVDAPCGFSPLGVMLASCYPQAKVFDMDLRDVIQEKRNRFKRSRDFTLPPNLTFIEADFRKTPLHQVLAEYGVSKLDVISFTATLFTLDELLRLAGYLRGLLSENGAVVSFGPWKPTVQHEKDANSLIRRQTNLEWKGIFESQEHAIEIFQEAGYRDIRVYRPSQMNPNAFTEVIDAEIFIVARC